jgi:hypothetical protein
MVDSFQHVNQPATQYPSAPVGSVAPPPVAQAHTPVPGSGQPQPQGQPAPQQQQPVAQQPQIDYAAEIARRDAELQQERSRSQQLQGVVSQIEQAAQANQRNQQFNAELQMMLAHADNLPADQAKGYLQSQFQRTLQAEQMRAQQERQQLEQRYESEKKQIAAPLYADHLLQANGLPPEARQELLALGDPELMYRYAPQIKARYDAWNAQIAGLQNGQLQQNRTQEVMALQNAGLGSIGGQNGGMEYQIEVSDDPDVAALQVLQHLRSQRGQ